MSINISFTDSEIIELVKVLGINNHIARKILYKAKKESPLKFGRLYE